MKKVKRNVFIVIAFLLSVIVSGAFYVKNVDAATNGQYSLKVGGENNDNLNIDNGSYIVTGNPGQQVELKLQVINEAKETRKFRYNVNTAYTTDGGALAYDKTKVEDPALKMQTRSTAKPNEAIFSVPGSTTATLTAKVTIPKEKFTGYIMGGFNISPYGEKAKGTVTSNGTLLKNKFSYSIPIQIRQKGEEAQEPNYSVTTVKPGTVNASKGVLPGVLANVHNSANAYAGQLSSEAIVTKKGDKSFKIKELKANQNLAPTSNYNYSISWGKKSLQAGDYHLKLTYKTAGGLKSWVINKDFTITNNAAAKYNKLAGIKPNYLWLYILLAILALAIILGLGIYLGKKNNNKNNGGNNNSGNTRRRRR